MTVPGQDRDWLSATLRELRKAAALSGMAAAAELHTSQRKISDLETGRQVPTEDQVQALAALYHATPAVRRQLTDTARALREGADRTRVVISRGAWKMQRRIAEIEKSSARIREYQGGVVTGLAQTRAYMRAVFASAGITGEDLERCISERIARQAILDSGRDITLLMPEGALRWQITGPAVMIEQLARLNEVSRHPGVRLGVIPWTTPATTVALHGFAIYDSREVVIGTLSGTAFITDQQDVRQHEKLWGELEALAAWNDDAREHLERIAADYRGLRN